MGDALSEFLSGVLVMGYFVAGLYFLRFWRDTRDRLFGIFAAAFWLLAVQRTALTMSSNPHGDQLLLYTVRLVAFVLLLAAILDKNRSDG
jgi:hypothetical protein